MTTVAEAGKPILSWEAVDGAVGYQILRATEANGTYVSVETVTDVLIRPAWCACFASGFHQ